jgi:hypothetical protein
MPAEQVDAMVAAQASEGAAPRTAPAPAKASAMASAPAPPAVGTAAQAGSDGGFAPVVTLLRELATRPEIQEFSLTSDDDSVVWRRG